MNASSALCVGGVRLLRRVFLGPGPRKRALRPGFGGACGCWRIGEGAWRRVFCGGVFPGNDQRSTASALRRLLVLIFAVFFVSLAETRLEQLGEPAPKRGRRRRLAIHPTKERSGEGLAKEGRRDQKHDKITIVIIGRRGTGVTKRIGDRAKSILIRLEPFEREKSNHACMSALTKELAEALEDRADAFTRR